MPGVYIGTSPLQAAYVGTTPVKEIYVGTTKVRPTYRTFTISWTEKSSMTSGWTYSGDAAGLTAGSTAFDDFFGYSAVRLNSSGVETAEVTQAQSGGAGKLDITKLGTLTSGDNVMIKFPVRGIKMTKSGSVITLSITDGLGRESEGYQYFAHRNSGTISTTTTPKDNLYIGAYKAYNSSNVLKSWSGQYPTYNLSQADFCTYAKANGTGYQIIGYYQRQLINAYYMMKYGNPNGRSKIGNGYTGSNTTRSTGGTNSQTNATYGTTANSTTQMKLFGLEDRWGNLYEYIGGAYVSSGTLYLTALGDYSGATSGGISSGKTMANDGNISAIAGDNKGMFLATSKVTNSSYNTYYCGYTYRTGTNLFRVSGCYNTNAGGNIFTMTASMTGANSQTGTRLIYLN